MLARMSIGTEHDIQFPACFQNPRRCLSTYRLATGLHSLVAVQNAATLVGLFT